MLKKSIKAFLGILMYTLLMGGCQPPAVAPQVNGINTQNPVSVKFSFGKELKNFTKSRAGNIVNAAMVSIKDNAGNMVYDRQKVVVYALGSEYITDSISVPAAGNYALTGLLLVSTEASVSYAAPLEGSRKANEVHYPLPNEFTAAADVMTTVPLEILPVYSTDTLADFGYTGNILIAGQSVTKDLAAEYMFAGNTLDTSGHNNHGTASPGLTLVSDRHNNPDNAFRFAGTDYIIMDKPVAGSEISISLWFMYEEDNPYNTDHNALIGYGDMYQQHLFFDPAAHTAGVKNFGNIKHFPNSTLLPGRLYHLCLVKMGTESTLYINGNLSGKITADFDNNTGPVSLIGNMATVTADDYRGVMDDIKIYSRTLSGAEISRLYTDKAPVVQITSPADNAIVSDTITLSANVTDDNAVASVEFYLGSSLLSTAATAPYTCSLATKAYANGSYTLTVKALDDIKNPRTAMRSIIINNPLNITRMPVSAGGYVSLAIKPDNTLISWGYNANGELGQGTTDSRNTPGSVANLTNIISIAQGDNHSVALKKDGTLWAWGYNLYGQLGDESTISKTVPLQVKNIDNVTAISAGEYFTLVVRSDKTVWSWGQNNYYQLGHSGAANQTLPGQVPGLANIAAVAGGYEFAAALKEDGTVWTWGRNDNGQCGQGDYATYKTLPTRVPGLDNVIAIDAGYYHVVALRNDNTVWAWGYNGYGNLGNGNTTNSAIPVKVNGLKNIIAVKAGGSHSLALRQDGTLWTWGYNGRYDLGINSAINQYCPVQVPGLANIAYMAAGTNHSLAVDINGNIFSWGYDEYGQLGDAGNTSQPKPVSVNGFPVIWIPAAPRLIPLPPHSNTMVHRTVAAGYWFTLVLKDNGEVWGWGWNGEGQLGTGSTGRYISPVQSDFKVPVESIAAGASHTVCLDAAGSVWCMGYNPYGQIGNNSYTNALLPAKVAGLPVISDITAGYSFTLALGKDGTVWAWGYNADGELGDCTTSNRALPVQVNGLTQVTRITGGSNHALALKADGTVWAWGYNNYGQLGDDSALSKYAPVQVEGLNNITDISAGGTYSMALKADGTVWAWGYNANGELGDGTTVNRYKPVQVNGLYNIVRIVSSANHTMALDNTGRVWVWGYNGYGNLGDYTSINKYTPVRLVDLTDIVDMEGSTGYYHSIAKDRNGNIYTWGYYYYSPHSTWYGAPGNGTSINNNYPVKIQFNTRN